MHMEVRPWRRRVLDSGVTWPFLGISLVHSKREHLESLSFPVANQAAILLLFSLRCPDMCVWYF